MGGRQLQGEGTYVEGVSPEGPGLLGGQWDVECGPSSTSLAKTLEEQHCHFLAL